MLLKYKKDIINIINYKIIISKGEEYILLGRITMAKKDHLTFFIIKFNFIPDFTTKLNISKVYYHEGIKNEGCFLEF